MGRFFRPYAAGFPDRAGTGRSRASLRWEAPVGTLLGLGRAPDRPRWAGPPALPMSKSLNQDEIDFLLRRQQGEGDGAAEPSAGPRPRVSPYDFTRPRLFSQDQMRVLQRVHELFARDVSVYLSSQLRTMVEISLTAVGQVTYSEYVASSAWPSALYVGEAVGLDDRLIFEIDPTFVIYTVEKLFGGPGEFLTTPREVSKIEQRIMSRVVRKAYAELESAWRQAHELKIKEVGFESNAEFIQILPSMEPGIVAAFEMRVQNRLVPLNLFYPYSLLDKMIGGAGMQRWAASSTTEVPAPVRTRYEETLRSMDVEIRAELGRTRLSLSEIAALQEGDVIPLQRWTDEPVRVTIGDQETLVASAGTSGKQYALRVLEVSAAAALDAFSPTP